MCKVRQSMANIALLFGGSVSLFAASPESDVNHQLTYRCFYASLPHPPGPIQIVCYLCHVQSTSFVESQLVLPFKTELMTTIPAHPGFWPKTGEHDVSLTSFTADLSRPWKIPLEIELEIESVELNQIEFELEIGMWNWWRKRHAKFGGDIFFRSLAMGRNVEEGRFGPHRGAG